MTQAYLEILGMLFVAAGIGVLFTYRYWKGKYDEIIEEKNQLDSDIDSLKSENQKYSKEIEKLKEALESLKINHENEVKKLKTQSKKDKDGQKSKYDKLSKQSQSKIDALQKQLEKEQKISKKTQKKLKELADEIEIKDEQLGEKERELEEIGKQLKTHNISYYKQIDGKRYKAAILTEADESITGIGDGRISKADAEKIFAKISDGHVYTQVEKDTMHYIREHYNWTPEADELFRKKVRSWAAKGHNFD
jgi:chromosome segregation ATPase